MAYDLTMTKNIFAKILGRDPGKGFPERYCGRRSLGTNTLVSRDIRPQGAGATLLGGPEGQVRHLPNDIAAEMPTGERACDSSTPTLAKVCDEAGVSPASGGPGYRAIANAGEHAHQEVPHFHVHIMAGRPLGPLLAT